MNRQQRRNQERLQKKLKLKNKPQGIGYFPKCKRSEITEPLAIANDFDEIKEFYEKSGFNQSIGQDTKPEPFVMNHELSMKVEDETFGLVDVNMINLFFKIPEILAERLTNENYHNTVIGTFISENIYKHFCIPDEQSKDMEVKLGGNGMSEMHPLTEMDRLWDLFSMSNGNRMRTHIEENGGFGVQTILLGNQSTMDFNCDFHKITDGYEIATIWSPYEGSMNRDFKLKGFGDGGIHWSQEDSIFDELKILADKYPKKSA
jgi:hypothetical protein